jgi:hypothetical protein
MLAINFSSLQNAGYTLKLKWRNMMEIQYSWWMENGFYLGYLDEYPQYPTQGEDIKDLENGLREIYGWIKDGTLKIKEQKGLLKIA